jgi:hypothetical protein
LRENFDRFNFAIHKEKEMADFRKWIIVLFALTLLAGLGMAQNPTTNNALNCSFAQTGAVTPQIRSESYTDAVGDIVIGCTGGPTIPAGNQIPQANVVVTMNTAVTSRVLGSQNGFSFSEALLLIDEPQSTLPAIVPGFGSAAPQTLCPTALTGCIEYAGAQIGSIPGLGGGQQVAVAVNSIGATTPGYNVFQGVVSGSSVTFFGVPILPPATSGIQRTFRITNIRINAQGVSAGSFGVNPVYANISTNGNTSLPLSNPQLTVGFVLSSLTTSVGTAGSYLQCQNLPFGSTSPLWQTDTISFTEKFATAFKTRVVPLTNVQYAAQGAGTPTNNIPTGGLGNGQNIPGGVSSVSGSSVSLLLNSESDFIFNVSANPNNTIATAGLADFGTRLKAVFTNIPNGITLYVSVNNLTNATTANLGGIGSAATAGNQTTQAWAQFVGTETAPEVAAANVTTGTSGVIALTAVNGSAEAVWEVLNANPNAIDSFTFGIYVAYSSNTAANLPTPAAPGYVSGWYAPTSASGAFTDAAGSGATSGPIPRFIPAPANAAQFVSVNICQTVLLWPYVTTGQTGNGFDTGLAISNTTTDPFGTIAQNGLCTLNWYGANTIYGGTTTTPTATLTTTTPTVASGTTWVGLSSMLQAVPSGNSWTGYVIGVCNFQGAHGYAAITDVGVHSIISSYLALVMEAGFQWVDKTGVWHSSAFRGSTPAPIAAGENFSQ